MINRWWLRYKFPFSWRESTRRVVVSRFSLLPAACFFFRFRLVDGSTDKSTLKQGKRSLEAALPSNAFCPLPSSSRLVPSRRSRFSRNSEFLQISSANWIHCAQIRLGYGANSVETSSKHRTAPNYDPRSNLSSPQAVFQHNCDDRRTSMGTRLPSAAGWRDRFEFSAIRGRAKWTQRATFQHLQELSI